jgi:hypothetical protein
MAGKRHNGNGHNPHATETPDVSHIKNVDVTHEASDVSVSGVLKFVAGLTALTVVVFLLMGGLFRLLNTQETEKEPDPGPMAMNSEERLPPEPRLQAATGFQVQLENGEIVKLENREPEAEYRVLREQWDQRLNCKSGGESQQLIVKCVPIKTAMDQIVGSGTLRTRVQGEGAKTAGIKSPTAWSSGRVTGKE